MDPFVSEEKIAFSALHNSNSDLTNVSLKTLVRWASRGARGHRLEAIRIGGRLMSSREALARFLAKLNSDDPPPAGVTSTSPPPPRSPHQRSRASASAAAELEAAGC